MLNKSSVLSQNAMDAMHHGCNACTNNGALLLMLLLCYGYEERWGAGVETQKNVRGEIGGWGRVPFNEPYAPSLSTIYNGA